MGKFGNRAGCISSACVTFSPNSVSQPSVSFCKYLDFAEAQSHKKQKEKGKIGGERESQQKKEQKKKKNDETQKGFSDERLQQTAYEQYRITDESYCNENSIFNAFKSCD